MSEKIHKTDEEWQKELTPEQFRIARKAGTERAFTGKYNASKEPGIYTCVCCGNPLFDSDDKFDSERAGRASRDLSRRTTWRQRQTRAFS
jgi:Conserved domain frequently associated with peptide methionine sulfoxide reductase